MSISDADRQILEDRLYRMTAKQQMLSSCTGALLTAVIVTPLDVVKIRLQSQQKALMTPINNSNRCFLYCNGLMDHVCHCINGKINVWVKRPSHFNSTFDAFGKIARSEGITQLWSGLPPTLIMAVPATMIYFVSYEQLRIFIKDRYNQKMSNNEQPLWIPLLSGGIARTWAVTVVNPLELVRTKMQSTNLSYREAKLACIDLYKSKGIRGFWLGWSPTIMRDVPFSAIYWASYEKIKKTFSQSQDPTLGLSFVSGALAGMIAGTVTLPFDVVKTHRQIELGELEMSKAKDCKLPTTMETLSKIYKSSGLKGLFVGIVPRLIKVMPACAIMISTYEFGKTYFKKYNKRKSEMKIT